MHGEFLIVDPPRLLEYTWQASWNGFAPTTVRCELVPADVDGTPGTRLMLTHTGFAGQPEAGEMHTGGWAGILAWLATYAGRQAR